MHICVLLGVLWVLGSCVVAFFEIPVIRRYHWRVVFWLVLMMPFFIYRISLAVWTKTC